MIARKIGRFLLFGLISWITASPAHADILIARVVAVLDGDTVDVLSEDKQRFRIRLAGIDAPEKGQAFGMAAKKHLIELASGKMSRIEWKKHDRYGRIVGKISIEQSDVGLLMVRSGYAWHFKRYQREQEPFDRLIYGKAEEAARTEKRGLWSEAAAMPPWEFRKQAGKNGRESLELTIRPRYDAVG